MPKLLLFFENLNIFFHIQNRKSAFYSSKTFEIFQFLILEKKKIKSNCIILIYILYFPVNT